MKEAYPGGGRRIQGLVGHAQYGGYSHQARAPTPLDAADGGRPFATASKAPAAPAAAAARMLAAPRLSPGQGSVKFSMPKWKYMLKDVRLIWDLNSGQSAM